MLRSSSLLVIFFAFFIFNSSQAFESYSGSMLLNKNGDFSINLSLKIGVNQSLSAQDVKKITKSLAEGIFLTKDLTQIDFGATTRISSVGIRKNSSNPNKGSVSLKVGKKKIFWIEEQKTFSYEFIDKGATLELKQSYYENASNNVISRFTCTEKINSQKGVRCSIKISGKNSGVSKGFASKTPFEVSVAGSDFYLRTYLGAVEILSKDNLVSFVYNKSQLDYIWESMVSYKDRRDVNEIKVTLLKTDHANSIAYSVAKSK